MDFQFHKELVDDIRKMIFSLGSTPLVDNAHCGISPLAFGSILVAEENQLREDQEARDSTTSLTPAAVRASKQKCPSIHSALVKTGSASVVVLHISIKHSVIIIYVIITMYLPS